MTYRPRPATLYINRSAAVQSDGRLLKNNVKRIITSPFPDLCRHFLSSGATAQVGNGLLILGVSRSHTTTHHTRYDSSERAISPLQRPLHDNTQHLQETRHPYHRRDSNSQSQQASGCRPSIKPRGHWDRLYVEMDQQNYTCQAR